MWQSDSGLSIGMAPEWLDLRPNEQLVWTGRPTRAPLVLRVRDLFMVPFSLVWAIPEARSTWRGLTGGSFGAVSPITFVFLAFAFYVTVGRFMLNWYLRFTTQYALTTERAVIRSGGPRGSVDDRWLQYLPGVSKKIYASGSGTIRFDPRSEGDIVVSFLLRRWHQWHDAGVDSFQFFRIADAADVVRLIEGSTSYGRA